MYQKNIKKRIKGIIFVELFGNTTDLNKLKKIAIKNNLSLIGDCAQSFGTKFNNESTCNYYDYAATVSILQKYYQLMVIAECL